MEELIEKVKQQRKDSSVSAEPPPFQPSSEQTHGIKIPGHLGGPGGAGVPVKVGG